MPTCAVSMTESMPVYHAEEYDYIRQMGINSNADEYLKVIEESKKITDMPVIASLNCISGKRWTNLQAALNLWAPMDWNSTLQ